MIIKGVNDSVDAIPCSGSPQLILRQQIPGFFSLGPCSLEEQEFVVRKVGKGGRKNNVGEALAIYCPEL